MLGDPMKRPPKRIYVLRDTDDGDIRGHHIHTSRRAAEADAKDERARFGGTWVVVAYALVPSSSADE